MTSVAEYHQAVKARLIADPLIVRFEIRRERRSVDDGHLRACLMLHNGDKLEFSEYVRYVHNRIEVVTYSFHWTDSSGRLIRRWDNAPHFSHLPQAPHHIHDGDKGKVLPGSPRTIVEVLDEIADIIASKDR
jgi:hypothetical protein